MSDLSNTQFFQVEPGPQISAKDILEIVFKALKEKGIIRSIRSSDISCPEIRHMLQVIMAREALL